MIKLILATAIAAALSACGPGLYRPTQGTQVTQYHDNFTKTTSFEGSNVATQGGQVLILRAIKSDGRTTYQVYIAHAYYGRWRMYDEMHTSDGDELPLTVISREVDNCRGGGGCTYVENVAGDVRRTYLEDRSTTGFSVQLSGHGVKEQFFIPGPYIQKFLSEVR